ncbi:MAG: hypothetical protein KTR31_28735 [Myxococcales bacterium]|nr:hypothetical protein [Myxococcales bacterium]
MNVKGRTVSWTDSATDQEQVVVTAQRLQGAHRVAKTVLARRSTRLAAVGLDPAEMVAEDRLRSGARRTLVEWKTGRSWHRFRDASSVWTDDSWLTWVEDPTAAVDDRYREVIAVHGRQGVAPWTVLWGVPHHEPPSMVHPQSARSSVEIGLDEEEDALNVEVRSEMTVAAPDAVSYVNVELPRAPGADAIPELRMAGERATPAGVPWGVFPSASDTSRGRWVLPRSAGPEPTQIEVSWRLGLSTDSRLDVRSWAMNSLRACEVNPVVDRAAAQRASRRGPSAEGGLVSFGGSEGCPARDMPRFVDVGSVHVGLSAVPRPLGLPVAFPAVVEVDSALPEGWGFALSGHPTSGQVLSVGQRSVQVVEPTEAGLTPVTVMQDPEVPDPSGLLWTIQRSLQGVMPSFPYASMAWVQGPDQLYYQGSHVERVSPRRRVEHPAGTQAPTRHLLPTNKLDPTVSWSPGKISVRATRGLMGGTIGAKQPVNEGIAMERDVVAAMALQWWSTRPFSRHQAWLPEALSLVYRDLFTQEYWGDEVASGFHQEQQSLVSTARAERLARALGSGLADRVGRSVLLEALDGLYVRGPHSMSGLQAHVERVSGESLDAYFGPWVHLDSPVDVTVELKRRGRVATLTSDVVLDVEVPVALGSEDAEVRWVLLKGGVAKVPLEGASELYLDPRRWLPLR